MRGIAHGGMDLYLFVELELEHFSFLIKTIFLRVVKNQNEFLRNVVGSFSQEFEEVFKQGFCT